MPPMPVNVAEQNARFHWPRMLFACLKESAPVDSMVDFICLHLICHGSRDIGVCAANRQKHTKVSDRRVRMESHYREANEPNQTVHNNDDASNPEAISHPGSDKHQNCRKCIRRGNKALRRRQTEIQVFSQDNWKEVYSGQLYILEQVFCFSNEGTHMRMHT